MNGMSTPPHNNGGFPPDYNGYPSNDPYGQQAGYGQPSYGQRPSTGQQPTAGNQGGYNQGGYEPDPYQQQYDAYTQPYQGAAPQTNAWPSQQMPSQYGASPTGPGPGGPAGPGWGQEPPKKNHLPIIIAIALVVIGAVVATILIVNKNSDSNDATASPTGQQSQSTDGGDSKGTGKSSGSEQSTTDSGSGSSSLPSSMPVPSSVEIDSASTYCSGNTCFGSFKADDPVKAYNDWKKALEKAGYTIKSSSDIYGEGTDAVWTIDAEGPLNVGIYYASGGAFTTS